MHLLKTFTSIRQIKDAGNRLSHLTLCDDIFYDNRHTSTTPIYNNDIINCTSLDQIMLKNNIFQIECSQNKLKGKTSFPATTILSVTVSPIRFQVV